MVKLSPYISSSCILRFRFLEIACWSIYYQCKNYSKFKGLASEFQFEKKGNLAVHGCTWLEGQRAPRLQVNLKIKRTEMASSLMETIFCYSESWCCRQCYLLSQECDWNRNNPWLHTRVFPFVSQWPNSNRYCQTKQIYLLSQECDWNRNNPWLHTRIFLFVSQWPHLNRYC